MEAIFFAIILLQVILRLFLKPSNNVLCCGLFGFAGYKSPSINALKILGFANDERGKDSCGYFYNGEIVKGVGKENTFYRLMQNRIINVEGNPNPIFIGHTRKLSVGAATEENAHPFLINDKWVIAHNGTIDNIWDLCHKYEVDTKDVHVDSKALALLIDKIGFGILEEYRGYAALLMHNLQEPDSLYVYHGKSRSYLQGEPVEERPLYFMDVEDGVYLSSLSEPLNAIRTADWQTPQVLNHNFVFKIKAGILQKEALYISREDNNIGIFNKTTYYYPKQEAKTHTKVIELSPPTSQLPKANVAVKLKDIDISKETLPLVTYPKNRDRVIFYKGLYHKVTAGGIIIMNGVHFIGGDGTIYDAKGSGIHPYYFMDGVLFENEQAMCQYLSEVVNAKKGNISSGNYALYISKYSRYPVLNPENKAEDIHLIARNKFYHKGKIATTSIQPLFSNRTYLFFNGLLTRISSCVEESVLVSEKKSPFASEDEADRLKLEALYSQMTKVYDSVEDMKADLSPEVTAAVHRYLSEVFSEEMEQAEDMGELQTALRTQYNIFLDEAVDLKICIADNMSGVKTLPHDYLMEAYYDYWQEDDDVIDIELAKQEKELHRKINSFLIEFAPQLHILSGLLKDNPLTLKASASIEFFLTRCEKAKTSNELSELVDKIESIKGGNYVL